MSNIGSPLTQHMDEPLSFMVKNMGRYKDCLTRQLKEAMILINIPNSLNIKGGFGFCEIPRITIEQYTYKQRVKELEE